jgi:MFS family permease
MWYLGTLYLQEVLHYGALDAGLAFLPMALTIMAGATQAGQLVAKFGPGRVLSAGLVLFAAGLALFARVNADGSYVTDFLAPGVLASAGIGLAVVSSTIAATATAAPGEAGLVSGLVNTSRQMGGALGIALLSTVAVEYSKHLVANDYTAGIVALDEGFRLAFAIAAAFALAGAAIAFRYIPAALSPPRPVQPVGPGAGGEEAPRAVAPDLPAPETRAPATPATGAERHAQAPAAPGTRAPAPVPGHPPSPGSLPSGAGRVPATTIAFSRSDGGPWPVGDGSSTVRLPGGDGASSPPA